MRRIVRYAAYIAAVLLVPTAITGALAWHRMSRIDGLGRGTSPASRSLPTATIEHDGAKRVAVILVSNEFTEVTDLFAPYAILSASGAFRVYTVAPERRVSDVWPGVALLPDLSFADFDAQFPQGADLIVVPYFGDHSSPTMVEWLRRHAADTHLLSVCEGGRTAAAAGLLAGHRATSHFYSLSDLASTFPDTNWVADQRAVVDGKVISSAGVTAGIDATLLAVRGMAGEDAFVRAAQAIGYDGSSEEVRPTGMRAADIARIALRAAYDWRGSDIGIVLAPGVDEIRLAAHLDTHARTFSERTMTLGLDGQPVRSRFGLTLYPRATLATAPTLDRVMRPDRAQYAAADEAALQQWAASRGLRIEGSPDTASLQAYDEQLLDIAATKGVPASRLAAKIIEYPTGQLPYAAAADGQFAFLAVQPLALALAGAAITRRATRRRSKKEPS